MLLRVESVDFISTFVSHAIQFHPIDAQGQSPIKCTDVTLNQLLYKCISEDTRSRNIHIISLIYNER